MSQPEPDRRSPTAYIYTEILLLPGDGDAQSSADAVCEQAKTYWQNVLEPRGIKLHEDPFIDTSAEPRYVQICDRPMGRTLSRRAQPGDHIIFGRCPCTAPELKDFCRMVSIWTSRSTTVHVAELQVNMTSPTGHVVAHALQLVAEGQRKNKSRQNRLIAQKSRTLRRPTNGMKRVAYKLKVGPDGHKYWVPDLEMRAVLNEVQRLREQEAKSWQEISNEIAAALAKTPNAVPYYRREWSRQRCQSRYARWLKIQEEERADSEPSGDADEPTNLE